MSGGESVSSKRLQTLRCTHHNVNTVVSDCRMALFESKEEQNQVVFCLPGQSTSISI